MKYYIGSDHAALDAKQIVINHLRAKKLEVIDCGTDSKESCHYPEYAKLVAEAVSAGLGKGILICGSGIGVSMVANRYSNVRATLVHSLEEAKLSRQHNDSNILCFGARTCPESLHLGLVDAWLETPFEGGRHQERLSLFDQLGEHPQKGFEYARGLEKILLIGLVLIIIISSLFGKFKTPYYEAVLAMEDGFLEWSTVVALLAGAVLSFKRLKALWGKRPLMYKLVWIAILCAFLFGAGEEVSWGQRLFGWESPSYFAENNSQGETNFHNLVVSGVKINKLIFGTGLGIAIAVYFLMLPSFYRRRLKWRYWINELGLPMPKLIHVLLYIGLAGAAHFTGSIKKGEILEFGGCWIFYLMMLWPYNGHLFDSAMSWNVIQKSDQQLN